VSPLLARRRLPILAFAALLALVIAGCGQVADPPTDENNGVYVFAGPVTYQLQVSRQLNQYGTEDSQYLKGVPAADTALAADQLWYGVFLWGKNQTKHSVVTSDNFYISDTQGNKYYPLPLNPSLNAYAWTAQTLAPGAIEPTPGTTAYYGPTQGGLLLFKLNATVYDNQPLTLHILGPTNKAWATISLDL
jgi:hypothetical protein